MANVKQSQLPIKTSNFMGLGIDAQGNIDPTKLQQHTQYLTSLDSDVRKLFEEMKAIKQGSK
jgi:hypothetical protein